MGFDPRTVQPVASRYTDSATWPTVMILKLKIVPLNTDSISISIKLELLYHSHKYILEYLRLVEPVIAIYAECCDGSQVGSF
jgi:hypothetical protein